MPLQSSSPILVSRAITRTHLTIGMHQSVFRAGLQPRGMNRTFLPFPWFLKQYLVLMHCVFIPSLDSALIYTN
jgi:hypothetical protein